MCPASRHNRTFASEREIVWLACGDFSLLHHATGYLRCVRCVLGPDRVTGVPVDTGEIETDYRQTPMLHAFAEALATGSVATDIPDTDDSRPILAEGIHGAKLAEWLNSTCSGSGARSVGRLPSIAIFVDGEGQNRFACRGCPAIVGRTQRANCCLS